MVLLEGSLWGNQSVHSQSKPHIFQHFNQYSDMEPFHYEPLASDTQSPMIRLLTLHPGLDGSDIECTLSPVSLHAPPVYEALSYHWGDSKSKSIIKCNEASKAVTENLFAALCQIRSPTRSRLLWIDAICINQSSDGEKTHQVRLMRRIYEAAQRVLIWLGPSSTDSWRAMALVPRLLRAKQAQAAANDKRRFYELNVEGQKAYDLPYIIDPAYPALAALLDRAWFSRVWIIQELAVSREAVVLCGSWEHGWDQFVDAIGHAYDLLVPASWDNTTRFERVVQIEAARRTVRDGGTQSLLGLLLLTRRFGATIPKDKVYALCGLANDAGPDALAIEPEYNVDNSTVFHMVALEMLKKGRNLDILSVPRVLKSSKIGPLPSWVPDWSISDFANSFRLPNFRGAPFLDYTATPLDGGYDLQIKNDTVIGLGGHVVDRIVKIGDLHSFHTDDGINWLHRLTRIPSEQAVFSNWEEIASARSASIYAPTGESILDAYWQTLIAGQTQDGLDAGREEYLKWDSAVRSNFRHMPTSPLLRWARGVVALPMLLAYGKSLLSGGGDVERIMQFRQKMTVATHRRLFRTQKGYLGLGPMGLSRNDAVTLLRGGMVPLVLRARGADQWELVGDCYVHGMMRGEAFVKERCQTLWIT